jgi:hypothetical protein
MKDITLGKAVRPSQKKEGVGRKLRLRDDSINSCLYSPIVYLTNALLAFRYLNIPYIVLFVCLYLTSILCRIIVTDETYILDQVFVHLVVFYGAYMYYIKFASISFLVHCIVISTFLGTIYLFEHSNSIKDKETSTLYHSLLHIVSSIGHHILIIA